MTTLAKFTIALLLALLASSCAFDLNWGEGVRGNGDIVEESRTVTENFTVVSAQEGLDVFVTQADEFSIRVEADENVIDLIGTDIKDGKLKVHAIENIGRATKNIYVSLPEVTALDASSGADLVGRNLIQADRVSLNASSGSDIQVELSADEVDADTSSGADIKLSGKANLLYANASSGSDIKATNFEASVCHADASSGADISIHVTESLVADASSGADIRYSGDAKVETKKSASGSVHKF